MVLLSVAGPLTKGLNAHALNTNTSGSICILKHPKFKKSDCAKGLYCFQRNKRQTVPGCIPGGTLDMNSGDYCYKPGVKTAIPFHTFHWSGHLRLMERCEGNCDNNNHCGWNVGSGLKCFQRNNKRPIPGCISIRAIVRPSATSASASSTTPSPVPLLLLGPPFVAAESLLRTGG